MKCASCGKESEYGICGRCLTEKNQMVSVPPVIEIIQCSRCGYFRLERWRESSLSDAIDFHLYRNLRVHPEFDVIRVNFESVGDEIGRYRLDVEGYVRDHFHVFKSEFEVRLKKIACEKCSRQAGGYYEAILQIRADKRKLTEKEINRILDIVENGVQKEKNNPKAFITKIETRREGIDIYLGDKILGQKLSRMISRETGADTKESSKIAGREDGRDFYRFTYLLKLPGFFKGDLVRDGNVIAVVRDVVKRKGYSIRTGKPVKLENPVVIARKKELMESSVLNVDEYTVEVLDPYTFQTCMVEKPEMNLNVGDTVYVAKDGEKLIVIHPDLVEL